jgi:Spy/CpxP family protein refolding chaperone
MSRTMSTLVVVGLMLAASGRSEAAQICGTPRDQAAEVLLGECDNQQPQGGTSAQDSAKRHKWWRGEEARTDFGITEQQSKELEAIFQQTLPMLKAKKLDVDREEKILATLMAEASTTNESKVVQAVEKVEAARSSLSRTFTMMQYRMFRLLTPEQRAKVQAYHDHTQQTSNPLSTRR